jgi:hypothetical protein
MYHSWNRPLSSSQIITYLLPYCNYFAALAESWGHINLPEYQSSGLVYANAAALNSLFMCPIVRQNRLPVKKKPSTNLDNLVADDSNPAERTLAPAIQD